MAHRSPDTVNLCGSGNPSCLVLAPGCLRKLTKQPPEWGRSVDVFVGLGIVLGLRGDLQGLMIDFATLCQGKTPLHLASEQGCSEIVKALLP